MLYLFFQETFISFLRDSDIKLFSFMGVIYFRSTLRDMGANPDEW